jgi:hypothetical protein
MVAHDEQLFWSGVTCGFYLPSTVAPIVRSRDGLPIGVQIVARPYEDRKTIAVASLEAFKRWLRAASGLGVTGRLGIIESGQCRFSGGLVNGCSGAGRAVPNANAE